MSGIVKGCYHGLSPIHPLHASKVVSRQSKKPQAKRWWYEKSGRGQEVQRGRRLGGSRLGISLSSTADALQIWGLGFSPQHYKAKMCGFVWEESLGKELYPSDALHLSKTTPVPNIICVTDVEGEKRMESNSESSPWASLWHHTSTERVTVPQPPCLLSLFLFKTSLSLTAWKSTTPSQYSSNKSGLHTSNIFLFRNF